jgi:hypothetical protein
MWTLRPYREAFYRRHHDERRIGYLRVSTREQGRSGLGAGGAAPCALKPVKSVGEPYDIARLGLLGA